MKEHLKIKLIIFTLAMFLPLMQANSQGANSSDTTVHVDPSDTVSLETFRNAIPADQGEWMKVDPKAVDSEGVTDGSDVDSDICQDYVWRPYNVGADWNPYSNGYWEYTNFGWMWVSYYSWGWGPYHYGRWWYSDNWGWVWSPGYSWAPCWVSWNYCGDYVGWYPLSPRCHWRDGYGYNIHNCNYRNNNWTFVEYKHFSNVTITKNVKIDPVKHPEITKTSAIVNDITKNGTKIVNKGPDATTIEKASGEKVKTRNIDNIKKIPVSVNTSYAGNNSSTSKGTRPKSDQPKSLNRNNDGSKGYTNGRKNKSNDNGYKPNGKKRDNNTVNKPNQKKTKRNGNNPNTKRRNGNNGHKGNTGNNGNTKRSNGTTHRSETHSKGTNKSGNSNNHSGKKKK